MGFLGPDLPPQPGEAEVMEGRGKAADQVGTEVDEVLVRRLLAQVVGALGEAHRVGQEGGSFLLDGCQGGLQLLVLEDAGLSLLLLLLELLVRVALTSHGSTWSRDLPVWILHHDHNGVEDGAVQHGELLSAGHEAGDVEVQEAGGGGHDGGEGLGTLLDNGDKGGLEHVLEGHLDDGGLRERNEKEENDRWKKKIKKKRKKRKKKRRGNTPWAQT